MLLQIDTSTQVCSCALSQNGQTIAVKEQNEANIHASRLTLFIQQLLWEHDLSWEAIDGIAVSKGPGSYTGLRIGVSTAKGLCYAQDIPLIGIPTLQSMAVGFSQHNTLESGARLVPMIDARRREVYQMVLDSNLEILEPTSAQIIDGSSFDHLGTANPLILFGDGANKFLETFKDHPVIRVVPGFEVSAGYMSELAQDKYKRKEFEDVAYFEPFYLKDFVATKPRKK